MARRIGALFAMIALLGLALLLVWHVYVHHTQEAAQQGPTVVSVRPYKMACALL